MADGLTRKQYTAATKAVAERTIEFTLSTSSVDRDNDTVSANGWVLDNYKKNPVVLWAHDYSQLPVAKATQIRVEGGALRARAEFAPESVYPFAATVFAMLAGGYLNAVSVGFRPLKFARNAVREGIDFIEQELLEFSVVPVPAHPDALVVGRGVNSEALQKWLRGSRAGDDEHVLTLDDNGEALHVSDWTASDSARLRAAQAGARRRCSEPFEPVIDITPAQLRDVMASIVADAVARQRSEVSRVIARETAAAINRARGRVD